MDVSALEWLLTVAVTLTILVAGGLGPARPRTRVSVLIIALYAGIALAFAGFVYAYHGADAGTEFVAGWITEYSLSVDNVFMFAIIMSGVPQAYERQVLSFGITGALILRAALIAIGAVAIAQFAWVFYIFGAVLLVAAIRLLATGPSARSDAGDPESGNSPVARIRARLPVTPHWQGLRLWTRENHRLVVTPLAVVIMGLAGTDLVFALDSIPAVFGLTQEPYLVYAANAFALMGLPHLYAVVQALMQRLRYLTTGLAVIMAFIGVKLVLHALASNDLPFIHDGAAVPVPEISAAWSVIVILLVLSAAAAASMIAARRQRPM